MNYNQVIFGDEENKYVRTMRSQRAGDCWKPVRIPCGMDPGAESETSCECALVSFVIVLYSPTVPR